MNNGDHESWCLFITERYMCNCKETNAEEICAGKVLLCPNPSCGDEGYYPVEDGYGGWEQCQCEFCYTVENSMFNYKESHKATKGEE